MQQPYLALLLNMLVFSITEISETIGNISWQFIKQNLLSSS